MPIITAKFHSPTPRLLRALGIKPPRLQYPSNWNAKFLSHQFTYQHLGQRMSATFALGDWSNVITELRKRFERQSLPLILMTNKHAVTFAVSKPSPDVIALVEEHRLIGTQWDEGFAFFREYGLT